MTQAKFTKTYNAFSGVDMVVTFQGRYIGELQGISYSVTREKVPLYTIGDANPRAFSRGKRGIAGALVFAVLDRSALMDELNSIRQAVNSATSLGSVGATAFGTSGNNTTFPNGLQHYAKDANGESFDVNIQEIQVAQRPNLYYDQILPFNVVITGANEYGVTTTMELIGLEILNSGSSVSIDEVQVNETCSFLARDIRLWRQTSGAGGEASKNVRI